LVTTESRLRTLVALAATGSVRAAASRLTVTESAVSASIGALARELGVLDTPGVSLEEFELAGEESGLLVEGDGGTLTHQGTRYHGFQRQA